MSQRIYLITPKVVEQPGSVGDVMSHIFPAKVRLVRAANPSQALRHVAKDTLNVTVPSQDDLIAAATAGAKVEEARAED